MKIKDFFITIFFLTTLLVVFIFFPAEGVFQTILATVVFLILIPIIFNRWILKMKIGDIGLQFGNWKQGLIWGGVSILFISGVFFIIIYFFDFLKNYTIPIKIVGNYKNFIIYEFFSVLPIIFIYDFFFRGFIMLTLGRKIGEWAILVQFLVFIVLIWSTGSQIYNLIPYMATALFAGVVVYKSRSIFYATILQFLVWIILDANIVRLIK